MATGRHGLVLVISEGEVRGCGPPQVRLLFRVIVYLYAVYIRSTFDCT